MKERHHKTQWRLGRIDKDCMELEEMVDGACQISGDLMRTLPISKDHDETTQCFSLGNAIFLPLPFILFTHKWT